MSDVATTKIRVHAGYVIKTPHGIVKMVMKEPVAFSLRIETGGKQFLQNGGKFLPGYMSHPTWQSSSKSLPSNHQTSLLHVNQTYEAKQNCFIKANSHIPCHSLAMACQKGFRLCVSHLIYTVRPCLIHTCHAVPMPRPCCSESDFSRPWHSAAWVRHGMCELASAIQRRNVGDLPPFSFFQLLRGDSRRLLPKAYQSVEL
jgi:hypothetical protein